MFMSYCPISSDGKIPGFEARIREFGERFWTPLHRHTGIICKNIDAAPDGLSPSDELSNLS